MASIRIPHAGVLVLAGLALLAGVLAAADPAPLNTPQDWLALRGADASRLAKLADGSPLSEAETEPLLHVLMAAGRVPAVEVRRFQQAAIPWQDLVVDPGRHRGEIMTVAGRVSRVSVIEPDAKTAERFQIPRYYRCQVLIDGATAGTIYALKAPQAWKPDAPLAERFEAAGFFVKFAGAKGGAPEPIFAAQRMAWYPAGELGDLKMDAGLFDDVNAEAEKPSDAGAAAPRGTAMSVADRDCFYGLLAAVARAKRDDLIQRTGRHYPIAPLFNAPDTQQGKLIGVTGTVQRCRAITVFDPEVKRLWGIDHYFELELTNQESQGHPIVFCVLNLPPDMPRGESIAQDVRLAGFFFKTWKYRPGQPTPVVSPDLTAGGKVTYQLAPLFIGQGPVLLPMATGDSIVVDGVTVCLLIAVIASFLAAAWWIRGVGRGPRTLTKLPDEAGS
jgi:hypothetical protein